MGMLQCKDGPCGMRRRLTVSRRCQSTQQTAPAVAAKPRGLDTLRQWQHPQNGHPPLSGGEPKKGRMLHCSTEPQRTTGPRTLLSRRQASRSASNASPSAKKQEVARKSTFFFLRHFLSFLFQILFEVHVSCIISSMTGTEQAKGSVERAQVSL